MDDDDLFTLLTSQKIGLFTFNTLLIQTSDDLYIFECLAFSFLVLILEIVGLSFTRNSVQAKSVIIEKTLVFFKFSSNSFTSLSCVRS